MNHGRGDVRTDAAGAEIVGILDTVDIPIVVVGGDGTLSRFNQAAADAFGLAASDVGRGVGTIAALEEVNDIEALCAKTLAGDAPRRRDIRSGDRRFLLRVAPYAVRPGDTAGAVLTFTNVTAFRASLEQAVYEREYAKTILNTITTPLVIVDAHFRVQSGNRAFYSMFAVSRDRAHGVPLAELGDGAWKASNNWTSLRGSLPDGHGGVQSLEVTCTFPIVGERTVLLDARPVFRDGEGALLVAVQDITDRKRHEQQLRDADRRKDEFLALLAHELRNPLAPIRTGLELIRLSGDAPQAIRRVRTMMERQVGQMVRLIDDLLDVSRITSGKIVLQRTPTPVSDLVQAAVEAQRAAIDDARISLSVELPSGPCVVDVDPTRFVQILSNVLHNASKFTPTGGTIRCAADVLPAEHVVITVSDSGIGISQDMLPRVFDLFTQAESPTQRAHGGLGIGLALARQLIDLHGGDIEVHSDGPGRGSTVTIRMPLCAAPTAVPAAQGVDPPRIRCRVVIIDDNRDGASVTAMLVEQLGGSARIAHDAESGLDAVREFRPDVVFLDIGLPGVDGYEVCRRLREHRSGHAVVIVAVTGWGQSQDKRRALDAGFDAHLTKPVDPSALADVLAAAGTSRAV